MIRFPNPSSDLNNFVKVFKLSYALLKDTYTYFNCDDLAYAAVSNNYATSRGFSGEQAIEQSKDESKALEPLYNQFKMYSELYRSFGWIKSSPNKKTDFSFTLLGDYIAIADDPFPLFKECALGINYPNEVINNESQNIRPFLCILKAMNDLDGVLTKIELIIGPMSIDDTNPNDYCDKINMIKSLRKTKNYENVKDYYKSFAKSLSKSTNTLDNYTRIPISILETFGWAKKDYEIDKHNIYKKIKNGYYLKITDEGRNILNKLNKYIDIRTVSTNELSHIKCFNDFIEPEDKDSIIRASFFKLLESGGFDINPIKEIISNDLSILNKYGNLLFSPYQTINSNIVDNALSDFLIRPNKNSIQNEAEPTLFSSIDIIESTIPNTITKSTIQLYQDNRYKNMDYQNPTYLELMELYSKYNNITDTVKYFCEAHKYDNQDMFYPLIGNLFNIIGLNCRVSRKGDNYQRFDAIIIDDNYSIPIEIKSPGEELNISTKAVRQALENKIILLSRKHFNTQFDTISLAVGFNLPNDRSDVTRLIEDIKSTFKINISLLDFETLSTLAIKALINNEFISIDDLSKSGGIINV